RVAGGRYARTIRAPGGPGIVELTPQPAGRGQVLLRVRLAGLRGLRQVVSRCRQLFDLDADPHAIAAVLAADQALAPLVAARAATRRGRPPGPASCQASAHGRSPTS